MGRDRRKRNAAGFLDSYGKRRERYAAVLRRIGLAELFAALPRRMQELYWRLKEPDPQVVYQPPFPTCETGRFARWLIDRAVRNTTVPFEGGTITVRDAAAVVFGLLGAVRLTPPEPWMQPEVKRWLEAAGPRLEACVDGLIPSIIRALWQSSYVAANACSRVDGWLFSVDMECPRTDYGKIEIRLIVKATAAQEQSAVIDGERRPIYRVAHRRRKSPWVSWTNRQLGWAGEREWPVFVQSHALHQLDDRVTLHAVSPFLQLWLGESLAEPVIVQRRGRELLVEYRMKEHRVGYLVATVERDIILVRTFLFLTMDGTPEGRKLERMLRMTRLDKRYTNLDKLETYTDTDLGADPVIRPILERCGCGQLFKLRHDDFTPKPVAAELRKYLRLAA